MPEYKTLNLSPGTYAKLVALAELHKRKLYQQADVIIDREFTSVFPDGAIQPMRVVAVNDLPHPPDAEPVPLVEIEVEQA